jgi:hypothetical protein
LDQRLPFPLGSTHTDARKRPRPQHLEVADQRSIAIEHFPRTADPPQKYGFHQLYPPFVNWITYAGTNPLHAASYRMA